MPRKDLLLIGAVLLLAAALLLISRLLPDRGLEGRRAETTLAPDAVTYIDRTPVPEAMAASEATAVPEKTPVPEETAEPEETAAPEATAEPEETATTAKDSSPAAQAAGPMPRAQTAQVRGYVVLTVGGRQYGDPIAMDREKIITIRQDDGKVNLVHITPEKVYMESSTCENQDCVGQGEISLDNYDKRILGTYVICLPNNVTIELGPAGEYAAKEEEIMRNQGARRIALSGLLTSLMLVFGLIERQFPLPIAVPGVKLGLANSVLLYSLYMLGIRQSVVLMLLKALLSWLIYMNLSAMLYSLAGGVLSLIAMILVMRIKGVSVIGVSALGAVFFNVGQILAAMLVLNTPQLLLTYLPVLMISGVVTGVLTGMVAQTVMKHLKHLGAGNPGER